MLLVSNVLNVGRSAVDQLLGRKEQLEDLDFGEAKKLVLKRREVEASGMGLVGMVGLALTVHSFTTAFLACNIPLVLLSVAFAFFMYEATAYSHAVCAQYRNADQWADVSTMQELERKIVLISGSIMRDTVTLFGKKAGKEVAEIRAAMHELERQQQRLEVLQQPQRIVIILNRPVRDLPMQLMHEG